MSGSGCKSPAKKCTDEAIPEPITTTSDNILSNPVIWLECKFESFGAVVLLAAALQEVYKEENLPPANLNNPGGRSFDEYIS